MHKREVKLELELLALLMWYRQRTPQLHRLRMRHVQRLSFGTYGKDFTQHARCRIAQKEWTERTKIKMFVWQVAEETWLWLGLYPLYSYKSSYVVRKNPQIEIELKLIIPYERCEDVWNAVNLSVRPLTGWWKKR